MPIYEFRCNGCGKKFEELVLSSSEKIKCPKCRKARVTRLMSAFSFNKGGAAQGQSSSGKSCAGCRSKNCGSCG